MRTSGRTALLTKPNLHRAGPGRRKKHKKRGAKGPRAVTLPGGFNVPHSKSVVTRQRIEGHTLA